MDNTVDNNIDNTYDKLQFTSYVTVELRPALLSMSVPPSPPPHTQRHFVRKGITDWKLGGKLRKNFVRTPT